MKADPARYPNYPDKHREPAYVSPGGELRVRQEGTAQPLPPLPEGVIFLYQASLWDAVRADGRAEPYPLFGLYTVGGRAGVLGGFGFGAPAACVRMEGLIALGVKRFVSIGTAGGLQPDLSIGDLVVCERAIRDEGTSHHYLPPARYAFPSAAATADVRAALERRELAYRMGASWTIDAPYRETVAEIRAYRAEGVAVVEMEAAALFAVGEHRGVEVAALFTISDLLTGAAWEPRFRSPEVREGLETIYEVALESLLAKEDVGP